MHMNYSPNSENWDAIRFVEVGQRMEEVLPGLYRLGRLSMDVTGLRCVGFNHELYTELCRTFNSASESPKGGKRKATSSPEETKRKQSRTK